MEPSRLLLHRVVLSNTGGGATPPPSFLQRLGHIVIFGLKGRDDRWHRCLEILKVNNITESYRATTEKNKSNLHRQSTSDFIDCLSRFGGPIVFFEDDFELVPRWEEVLRRSYESLPLGWDLLYLGCNLTTQAERSTPDLIRVKGAWCMHGVVISDKFRRYIVKYYDVNRNWVFDEWMRKAANDKQFYMTYPMICYQRPGYSDFAGRVIDHKLFENKFYRQL